jgi:hypothetical protein
MHEADFLFAPGIHASISGSRSIVDAFRREYAPLEILDRRDRSLELRFGRLPPGAQEAFGGRHKSVGWRVRVSPADRSVVDVAIQLSGAPRSFARSLVQGYVVEPMVSVIAAERDLVLVPGAGVAAAHGLTLILGRSGAGKSTLMARLSATGNAVLADDQLFVDSSGQGRAFPRRLRFYPDIEWTAPEAFARLPYNVRTMLLVRRLMATASGGLVRPSLGVDRAAIGAAWVPGPVEIQRIVLLERGDHTGDLRAEPATSHDAVGWATDLLREQRARLAIGDDAGWLARLVAVVARERATLTDAFADRPVERLVVPRDQPAREAVSALARHLGYAI